MFDRNYGGIRLPLNRLWDFFHQCAQLDVKSAFAVALAISPHRKTPFRRSHSSSQMLQQIRIPDFVLVRFLLG